MRSWRRRGASSRTVMGCSVVRGPGYHDGERRPPLSAGTPWPTPRHPAPLPRRKLDYMGSWGGDSSLYPPSPEFRLTGCPSTGRLGLGQQLVQVVVHAGHAKIRLLPEGPADVTG